VGISTLLITYKKSIWYAVSPDEKDFTGRTGIKFEFTREQVSLVIPLSS
jgi:hypothetical protein